MTTRALTILIVAVLFVGGAAVAIAGTLGGGSDDGSATHAMPGGQSMTGSDMEK